MTSYFRYPFIERNKYIQVTTERTSSANVSALHPAGTAVTSD